MKLWVSQLSFSLLFLTSAAVHYPLAQVKRSPDDGRGRASVLVANAGGEIGLATVSDLIYMTNITLGGTEYTVQLDTGSSDLWVQGPTNSSSPLPGVNQTTITCNLTYGIGWAYGNVAYSTVNFAGISVRNQAFMDASSSLDPAVSYGAHGVLGLGFTSLSTIDQLLNDTASSSGRSLLHNLFLDNPSEPNFIAFSLQRSTDSGSTVEGTLSVGEYNPSYAAVANNTPIPTWPVTSPQRWNVLLDAVILTDQTVIPSTQIPNAPGNKAVVLLDSGTSYTYAPTDVCNAIYGNIPGAQFDTTLGQWRVPCNAEIDMALQFNGQVFPIHPLDVNPANPADTSSCLGSFIPQSISIGSGQFDWLIGDNFLRNVYTVYDFGDFDSSGSMGAPYVQLLSLTDPNQASAEFHQARGGTPQTNITYKPVNSASSPSDSTSVTLSSSVAETLDKIGMYFPAMLGVMALNALVLIILVIVGIVMLCRGRTKRSRVPRGRKSPMPPRRASDIESLQPQLHHAYQPVSMALTDDTMFVPPSPNFHKLGHETSRKSALYRASAAIPESTFLVQPSPIHSGDRPNSASFRGPVVVPEEIPLTPPSPGRRDELRQSFIPPPTVVPAEDEVFVPPSPSYHSFEGVSPRSGDRPMSVASPHMGRASADGTVSPAARSIQGSPTRPGSRQSVASSMVSQQQVGVAVSDDALFVPPSRAFLSQQSNIRPGDRPQSFVPPPGTRPPYQGDALSPPSPGFHSWTSGGDRPRSIA